MEVPTIIRHVVCESSFNTEDLILTFCHTLLLLWLQRVTGAEQVLYAQIIAMFQFIHLVDRVKKSLLFRLKQE